MPWVRAKGIAACGRSFARPTQMLVRRPMKRWRHRFGGPSVSVLSDHRFGTASELTMGTGCPTRASAEPGLRTDAATMCHGPSRYETQTKCDLIVRQPLDRPVVLLICTWPGAAAKCHAVCDASRPPPGGLPGLRAAVATLIHTEEHHCLETIRPTGGSGQAHIRRHRAVVWATECVGEPPADDILRQLRPWPPRAQPTEEPPGSRTTGNH